LERKDKNMAVLYGVRSIRITPELDGGGEDASATALTCDDIQSMDIAPVYVDGNEATLRGGDSIKAIVKEEDTFRGVDITMVLATFDEDVKAAIVGGTATADKWEAPADTTENPFPFRLEVWVANYTESDSQSTQDGYMKYEFPYCIGRLGSQNPADQSFALEQYVISARRNESDASAIEPAITMEVVSSIT
jgi:hypothetical protein